MLMRSQLCLTFAACRFASRVAALAALAACVLLASAGCHQSSDSAADVAPLASFKPTPDTPTHLPPTPALFQTVMLSGPSPAQQVAKTTLPSPPPDFDKVAQSAAASTPPAQIAAASPSDAGLIVSDPVAGSPELNSFAAGCGRWLDLIAAGQPELGRTPLWEDRGRVTQELKRHTMQFTPADSASLHSMTGATVAAFGTLVGKPTACTLTYRLYALPGGAPIAPSLTKSGDEGQILAALPGMAQQIDMALGVPSPRVPKSVGLTPAQLSQMITIATGPLPRISDIAVLAKLAELSPIAGCYYLDTNARLDQALLAHALKTLMAQQPENALMLAHIGYAQPAALRRYAALTKALFARYPKNALLAHAEVWEQRIWGNRDQERKAAERTVSDSPESPSSWLTHAYTVRQIADDLRQGRFASDISQSEWADLSRLYGLQEDMHLHATRLDPHDGHAWLELAESSTAFGDMATASHAMTEALALDPDKAEVYCWALQMYQPKWHGNPATLQRFATLSAAEPWADSEGAIAIAESLKSADLTAQADTVLANYVARERKEVAKFPTEASPHWNLAAALAAQGKSSNLREATLEYRTAEHFMPNAPSIHRALASVLYTRGRDSDAIAEYRIAIALYPFSSSDHAALGRILKHDHQFPQALAELHLAMRLDPRNADVYATLGDLEMLRNNYKQAAIEYKRSIHQSYYSLMAWISVPGALDMSGQYDDAIAMGQKADRIVALQQVANNETEPPIHDSISDGYLHKKAWSDSLSQSDISLKYNPGDACAYENYGEAYIGEGRKAEARAAWRKAVSMGNPQITPVAAKMLAKYP